MVFTDLTTKIYGSAAGENAVITRYVRGLSTYSQACQTCQPQAECIACIDDQMAEIFAVKCSDFTDATNTACADRINGTHTIRLIAGHRGMLQGDGGVVCSGSTVIDSCNTAGTQYICAMCGPGNASNGNCAACTETHTAGPPKVCKTIVDPPLQTTSLSLSLYFGGGFLLRRMKRVKLGARWIMVNDPLAIPRGITVAMTLTAQRPCVEKNQDTAESQYCVFNLPIATDIDCLSVADLQIPLFEMSVDGEVNSHSRWRFGGSVSLTALSNTTFARPAATAGAGADIGGVDVG